MKIGDSSNPTNDEMEMEAMLSAIDPSNTVTEDKMIHSMSANDWYMTADALQIIGNERLSKEIYLQTQELDPETTGVELEFNEYDSKAILSAYQDVSEQDYKESMIRTFNQVKEQLEIVRTRLESGFATPAQIADELNQIATSVYLMFIQTSPQDVQEELLTGLQL